MAKVTSKPCKVWKDYHEPVAHVALSNDGNRALSASLDGTSYIHFVHGTGEASTKVNAHGGPHGGGTVFGAEISGDGTIAATAGMDGKVRIWDTSTAAMLAAFTSSGARYAASVSMTADTRTLAAAFVRDDSPYDALDGITVAVYTLHGGTGWAASRCVSSWNIRAGRRVRIALSVDGSLLAHTLAGGVAVVDATTKVEFGAWRASGDAAIALDTSADNLAIADARTLRICPISGQRKARVLSGYSPPLEPCVTYGDYGSRIAAAVRKDGIRVWCAHSGDCLIHLRGSGDDIASVAFSFDGSFILGGSYNNKSCIWRLKPTSNRLKNKNAGLLATRRHSARAVFHAAMSTHSREKDLLHIQAKSALEDFYGHSDLKLLEKYAVSQTILDCDNNRFGSIDEHMFLRSVAILDEMVEEKKKPSDDELLTQEFVSAAGHIEHVITVPVAVALLERRSGERPEKIRSVLVRNSNGTCISIDEFLKATQTLATQTAFQ